MKGLAHAVLELHAQASARERKQARLVELEGLRNEVHTRIHEVSQRGGELERALREVKGPLGLLRRAFGGVRPVELRREASAADVALSAAIERQRELEDEYRRIAKELGDSAGVPAELELALDRCSDALGSSEHERAADLQGLEGERTRLRDTLERAQVAWDGLRIAELEGEVLNRVLDDTVSSLTREIALGVPASSVTGALYDSGAEELQRDFVRALYDVIRRWHEPLSIPTECGGDARGSLEERLEPWFGRELRTLGEATDWFDTTCELLQCIEPWREDLAGHRKGVEAELATASARRRRLVLEWAKALVSSSGSA